MFSRLFCVKLKNNSRCGCGCGLHTAWKLAEHID